MFNSSYPYRFYIDSKGCKIWKLKNTTWGFHPKMFGPIEETWTWKIFYSYVRVFAWSIALLYDRKMYDFMNESVRKISVKKRRDLKCTRQTVQSFSIQIRGFEYEFKWLKFSSIPMDDPGIFSKAAVRFQGRDGYLIWIEFYPFFWREISINVQIISNKKYVDFNIVDQD